MAVFSYECVQSPNFANAMKKANLDFEWDTFCPGLFFCKIVLSRSALLFTEYPRNPNS